MLKFGIILVMAVFLASVAGPACLAEEETAPMVEKKATPMTKLTNGLINVLTGWIEIPTKVYDNFQENKNIFEAITIGTLKGVFHCAGRTIAGAVDAGAFFIPPYDQPLVEPLYHF